jgi:hypothetical protein
VGVSASLHVWSPWTKVGSTELKTNLQYFHHLTLVVPLLKRQVVGSGSRHGSFQSFAICPIWD